MRILTARDMARLESAVRKIERMAEINNRRRLAVHSGWSGDGDGDTIPTDRMDMVFEAVVVDGNETDYVTLDRDRDRNKVLYWHKNLVGEQLCVYLPSNPQIGDTYWLAMVVTDLYHIEMTNDNHYVAGPISVASFDRMAAATGFVFASWFDYITMFVEHYVKEFIILDSGPGGHMLNWFVITYTGREKQVAYDYDDVDGDGYYQDPDWGSGYELAVKHPLRYKTCTEWMIRQLYGSASLSVGWRSSRNPW